MQTSLRTARTILQNAGRPAPDLTTRQRDTRERVLTYAQTLMAACGALTLKFSTLAAAVHVAPSTLRHYFADLDDLLTVLVVRHLDTLLAALSETPNDDPNRDQNRRSAYLAATRTASGALTEAHLLLVRDRHFLPQDELTHIEAYRHQIGTLLAGDRAQLVLHTLDNPHATPDDIEALLGNLRAAPRPAARPQPATSPLPAPRPAAPRLPAKGDFIPNVAYVPPPGFFEELERERAERPGPATFPHEPPNPA
jgi:AcrR family transcriptional regulator